MNLSKFKDSLGVFAGRKLLVVQKHSPELLLGVGIVGVVVSTVMACKASTKAGAVLDAAAAEMEKIHEAEATISREEYTKRDQNKDSLVVMIQTGVDFAKLYGPSVLLGAVSIGCILGSHNIMRKRNVALVAAYKMVKTGFEEYRDRVIEDLGEEKDKEYRYGVKYEKLEESEVDPVTGKVKKVKKNVPVISTGKLSPYAREFCKETTPQWHAVPEYNALFLKAQQNAANDFLKSRGHIFLNDVYDMLGFSRTSDGAVVGWVNEGNGDQFVDFGLWDSYEAYSHNIDEEGRLNRTLILDFNVDGVIYDLI